MANWLTLRLVGLFQDRVIRNITLTVATRAVAFACTVVATIIAGRYLGPSDFGRLNFALGFVTLAISITELMAGTIATREIARHREMASAHLSSLIGARLISVLAACVITLFAILFVNDPVTQLLLILAMLQLPAWIPQSAEVWFVASIDLTLPNIFRVISHGALLILTIAIVFYGKGVLWLMAVNTASLWLYSVLTFGAASTKVHMRVPSLESAFNLLRRSFAFGIASTIWRLQSQLPMSLVYLACGSFQAGLYAAASKFIAVADWSISAFTLSLYPAMSEVVDDRELFRQRLIGGLAMMCAFGMALATFVASCSSALIQLTFGSQFAGAHRVLVALSPTLLFMFASSHLAHALISLGGRSQYFSSACVAALSTFILVTSLGKLMGALGSAVGMSLASLIALVASAVMIHRLDGKLVPWGWFALRASATVALVGVALMFGLTVQNLFVELAFGISLSMLAFLTWRRYGSTQQNV
ncbi:MAG: oligosaccharide flippase family protein [Armatimonadota bacterium]|nr:oligosaccharide flippase family protein [Armatimonadota bacterium]MCX7777718.1 oligosaccharide flippase family protein [Armatimonadota bacterium]MDW8025867.1 oligosaccharide flippase family protein [Armatimonadota bacterium]